MTVRRGKWRSGMTSEFPVMTLDSRLWSLHREVSGDWWSWAGWTRQPPDLVVEFATDQTSIVDAEQRGQMRLEREGDGFIVSRMDLDGLVTQRYFSSWYEGLDAGFAFIDAQIGDHATALLAVVRDEVDGKVLKEWSYDLPSLPDPSHIAAWNLNTPFLVEDPGLGEDEGELVVFTPHECPNFFRQWATLVGEPLPHGELPSEDFQPLWQYVEALLAGVRTGSDAHEPAPLSEVVCRAHSRVTTPRPNGHGCDMTIRVDRFHPRFLLTIERHVDVEPIPVWSEDIHAVATEVARRMEGAALGDALEVAVSSSGEDAVSWKIDGRSLDGAGWTVVEGPAAFDSLVPQPSAASAEQRPGPGERPPPALIKEPYDAEVIAARWLRWMRFPDAAATPRGRDGGIDILGTGIVAQVKTEKIKTSRPVVQQSFGIAQLESCECAVFSLAGFTDEAISWARRAEVALFEFNLQGEPVAVTGRAHEWISRNL